MVASPARGIQSWNSVERYQKLIRLGKARNELAHKIWAQSNQGLIWKCAETARPTRGQETEKFSRAWPEVNQFWEVPYIIYPPSLPPIPWKCSETTKVLLRWPGTKYTTLCPYTTTPQNIPYYSYPATLARRNEMAGFKPREVKQGQALPETMKWLCETCSHLGPELIWTQDHCNFGRLISQTDHHVM